MGSAASWDTVLEAEGLGILAPTERLHGYRDHGALAPLHIVAVERWQRWAKRVLVKHKWQNAYQRQVWKLYAEGVSTRDIPARVAGLACYSRIRSTEAQRFVSSGRPRSRYAIQRIIAAVKREHPGPPSPWAMRSLKNTDAT